MIKLLSLLTVLAIVMLDAEDQSFEDVFRHCASVDKKGHFNFDIDAWIKKTKIDENVLVVSNGWISSITLLYKQSSNGKSGGFSVEKDGKSIVYSRLPTHDASQAFEQLLKTNLFKLRKFNTEAIPSDAETLMDATNYTFYLVTPKQKKIVEREGTFTKYFEKSVVKAIRIVAELEDKGLPFN